VVFDGVCRLPPKKQKNICNTTPGGLVSSIFSLLLLVGVATDVSSMAIGSFLAQRSAGEFVAKLGAP
jgi:hypothetical protein